MNSDTKFTPPEEITFEYLQKNRHNKNLATYLDQNYFTILAGFDPLTKPEICQGMAYCIYSKAITMAKEEAYPYHRHVINIARIGLNEFSEKIEGMTVETVHQINSELIAHLFTLMAFSMFECDRPISALGYLDYAENYIEQAIELLGKDTDTTHLSIMYECDRAKEAEIYYKIIPDLPLDFRPMFATVAFSYMSHAIKNLQKLGDKEMSSHYIKFLSSIEELCIKYPIKSKQEIDQMNRDTIKDDYIRWCQNNYRFLNLFNEIPHSNEKYAKDDLNFDLNERYQMLMEDIIRTYDHCRHILYRVSKPDISFFCGKERDEDVESLLDCYVRMYTLLDKTAKVINHIFPRDEVTIYSPFYEVAKGFKNSKTKYLNAIYHVCTDIFPDKELVSERTFDPRLNDYGIIIKNGIIRNNIAHDTVNICKDSDSKAIYYGVVSITPMELYHYTSMLFYDVREVILLLQLAYNHCKNQ